MAQVEFTSAAAARVAKLIAREGNPALNLRLRVDGGGCSGFQYKFDFDTNAEPGDLVVERDGVKLLVDEISLPLLDGCVVDYVQSLAGAAFQVSNPNAQSSCGCGASFNI